MTTAKSASRVSSGTAPYPINDLASLRQAMSEVEVQRLFCKKLAQNDNSKQQIYLWRGNWGVINLLPLKSVSVERSQRQHFKAKLDFSWLLKGGQLCAAPSAQLIMYPDYPEIRLSGFLRGCPKSLAEKLRPVAKEDRNGKGVPDGRVLVLGVTPGGRIIAHLAAAGTLLARELQLELDVASINRWGVLHEINAKQSAAAIKNELLKKLARLKGVELPPARKMGSTTAPIKFTDDNAAGYTLEAYLGIPANARAEPDYKGWEIKAFSGSKITVIEPEPDGGYYKKNGCRAFLRLYGKAGANNKTRFVGQHKVGTTHASLGTTLKLVGYDPVAKKIINAKGSIKLIDKAGATAASWSFASLLTHWSTKHFQAAYVPYKRGSSGFNFVTKSQVLDPASGKRKNAHVVWICEGTDFAFFLHALFSHTAIYDPGSSILTTHLTQKSGGALKARNQFRVSKRGIPDLYEEVTPAFL
ncbi:MvaI/BcnI family restriction endonuclease [Ramlibacter sp.]|uniref:MvaI/BcnI family restriction endonuclease n=1 Tax=Ramlibacter sp. TaxID=1917967 RepID=UPI002D340185|nr:MvaI/BcnI family restriction endonuclease [Ramlibacter sp.]HYD77537.1 MvaI/BcnI family restriction endonuclease [Ramlibacter sp.]